MGERGVEVDHSSLNRWVRKYVPLQEKAFGQAEYLNNVVEQDHSAIKRIARPMLGFKSFW
jgi:transposase-like protein